MSNEDDAFNEDDSFNEDDAFNEDDSFNENDELTLTNDEYYQYLLNNCLSYCGDFNKIKHVPKSKKSNDPEIVKVGDLEIVVKNYSPSRIKQIFRDYFGDPDKGGIRLEKIWIYKWGRYPGQYTRYNLVDCATNKIVVHDKTLHDMRIYLSGIAKHGFPLKKEFDQIFMFRVMSWQEHGFPDFPA